MILHSLAFIDRGLFLGNDVNAALLKARDNSLLHRLGLSPNTVHIMKTVKNPSVFPRVYSRASAGKLEGPCVQH
jgi:hypothetical protein